MCTNKTPEVTASPSVKTKVLQEGSEPQLLLALSEAWGGPRGGHLRGQGACTSLLQSSLYEAWLGHPAAACDGVQTAVGLVCRWSLSAFAALAGSQHHGFMRVSPATRGSCATAKQLPVALDRGTAQAAVLHPLCFLCKKS